MVDVPLRMPPPRALLSENPTVTTARHISDPFLSVASILERITGWKAIRSKLHGNAVKEGVGRILGKQQNIKQVLLHEASRPLPIRMPVAVEMFTGSDEHEVQNNSRNRKVGFSIGAKQTTEIDARAKLSIVRVVVLFLGLENPVPIVFHLLDDALKCCFISVACALKPTARIICAVAFRVFVPDGCQSIFGPLRFLPTPRLFLPRQRNFNLVGNC